MPTDLTLRVNVWLERDGQVALSDWRVRLLQAVADTGSISAAAERLGVQYRLAWERLDEMEHALGQRLVERQVGGTGGGGARLTAAGQDYVARFERLVVGINEEVSRQFAEVFGPS